MIICHNLLGDFILSTIHFTLESEYSQMAFISSLASSIIAARLGWELTAKTLKSGDLCWGWNIMRQSRMIVTTPEIVVDGTVIISQACTYIMETWHSVKVDSDYTRYSSRANCHKVTNMYIENALWDRSRDSSGLNCCHLVYMRWADETTYRLTMTLITLGELVCNWMAKYSSSLARWH